jgi:thiamine-phosphate pyrophosphorylase
MVDFSRVELYLVTDPGLSRGRSEEEVMQAAHEGGVDLMQFRNKNLSEGQYFSRAQTLCALAKSLGMPLLLNDYVAVAALLDCDGIHVGQSDLPVPAVRQLLGKHKTIGLSTHSVEQAREAHTLGADYLNVGPVFATATKNTPVIPVGAPLVRDVTAFATIPVTTMGGIKLHNLREVILAGADRVAVVTAITDAEDMKKAALALKAAIREAKQERQELSKS